MERKFKTLLHAVVGFGAVLIAYQTIVTSTPLWELPYPAMQRILAMAAMYGATAGLMEIFFRVERSPWRFSSTHDAFLLMRSTTTTALLVLLLSFILNRAEILYRSVLLITWAIQLGALCAGRLVRRAAYEGAFNQLLKLRPVDRRKGQRLLVVGSLGAADTALRYLETDPNHTYGPVGVVVTDSRDRSKLIRNVPVAGSVADWTSVFEGLVAAGRAPEGVLFLDSPANLLNEDQLGALYRRGVSLIRLPQLTEAAASGQLEGFAGVKSLSIEELLSRPTRKLNLAPIRSLIEGRRVFVTGAGGSIGSELCRQIAALGCEHLTMLDHSEFLLFEIDRELRTEHPNLSKSPVLCNVRDGGRLRQWVEHEAPDILFHAAALKHVPLVEEHPDQGFLTNVIGTRNVVDAVLQASVADMVLISTDKAVSPSNTMGATKRLAEEVVRLGGKDGRTRFTAVRFGNVLGSAGSVVPTFLDQIARGGPVTVTHPEVERYFMTIPEAVQLVLYAVASRKDHDRVSTYVLDMGEPVRIQALAERLIFLSGKTPGKDIMIEYVGLRPGEKLAEVLIDEGEVVLEVREGVMEIGYPALTNALSDAELANISQAAQDGRAEHVRSAIDSLIRRIRAGTA